MSRLISPYHEVLEAIARVCHEANRAYCVAIGDTSQVAWDDAPKWQRESALNGVRRVLDFPTVSPAQLHANWWEEKKRDGWVYGEVKDVEKKTHPCCIPYDQLPPEQQRKDKLFRAIVDALRPPCM